MNTMSVKKETEAIEKELKKKAAIIKQLKHKLEQGASELKQAKEKQKQLKLQEQQDLKMASSFVNNVLKMTATEVDRMLRNERCDKELIKKITAITRLLVLVQNYLSICVHIFFSFLKGNKIS